MAYPSAVAGARPRAQNQPLAAFAAAYALALVAHHLWWRGLPGADLHGLVVLLAAWVLVRPAGPGQLAALALAEAVAVARDLPTIGDHTLLAAVTAAGFAGVFGVAAVRERRIPAPAALWSALAPFLRVQAVLLYAAAGLAKLNTGFLDAATSCAGPLAAQLSPFASSALGPLITATVAIELALAVLLAVPRTRTAGVVLGAGFHAVLALAGNVPFAAYALALYVAFLSVGRVLILIRVLALAVGALSLAALLAGPDLLRPGLEVLFAAGLLAFALGSARRGRGAPPAPAAGRIRDLRPGFAVLAALLVLNAAGPYLGLKTEASFAMFSNLQTEPGHWNHVLVPEAVRVFGAQDELVRLESATAPELEARRRAGVLMVRHELERYLRRHPGEHAAYADATDPSRRFSASAATLPAHPVLDRVLNFYDVRQDAAGRC